MAIPDVIKKNNWETFFIVVIYGRESIKIAVRNENSFILSLAREKCVYLQKNAYMVYNQKLLQIF